MGTDGLAVLAGDELKTWHHGDLVVYARGFASAIQEIGPIEGLRKVDVTLKRGKEVRLRVCDSSGKPIPPKLMPLPQVYLASLRQDAVVRGCDQGRLDATELCIAATSPSLECPATRSGGTSFLTSVPAVAITALPLASTHPDVILFFERGPDAASELAGRYVGRRAPSARVNQSRHQIAQRLRRKASRSQPAVST